MQSKTEELGLLHAREAGDAPEGTSYITWVTKGGCRTAKGTVAVPYTGGQPIGQTQSTAWS